MLFLVYLYLNAFVIIYFSQWEHAISCYQGEDPLDLWFQFICWLESCMTSDNNIEAKFRKSVEHCLSLYEKYDRYKQDLRMVKLWIKYVSIKEFFICP